MPRAIHARSQLTSQYQINGKKSLQNGDDALSGGDEHAAASPPDNAAHACLLAAGGAQAVSGRPRR